VPKKVRESLRTRVSDLADKLQWDSIPNGEKAAYYDQWTEDPHIGGVLERYIDKAQVRVHVKDTLVKYVMQHRRSDGTRPLKALGISGAMEVVRSYRQPHGRALVDGRVICWGRADAWRSVLLALHERTYCQQGLRRHGVVLLRAVGRYQEDAFRAMVTDAATRLGIERVVWLES
jgi:hypothetical protein